MFRTKVTEMSALAGFVPAGKPANRRERFCSTRNSMKRIVDALGKLDGGKRACAVLVLCATTAIALPAQTFTTLHSFCAQTNCRDGAGPNWLVQATNGNLYGITAGGGAYFDGSVYEIAPSGTLTPLDVFSGANNFPEGALVLATNGDLYGTTYFGGANDGTVFKITPTGKLTTLYTFCSQSGCPDGARPAAGLVLASSGNFYGTTQSTAFEITPGGTLTTLHSFDHNDGYWPGGALVQAPTGAFYGQPPGGRPRRRTASTTTTGSWPAGPRVKAPTGTSTGQPRRAGPPSAPASLPWVAGRSSKSPPVARSRPFIAFACKTVVRTARIPMRGSSRPPTGTSTGQPRRAGPTAVARSLKSPRLAR